MATLFDRLVDVVIDEIAQRVVEKLARGFTLQRSVAPPAPPAAPAPPTVSTEQPPAPPAAPAPPTVSTEQPPETPVPATPAAEAPKAEKRTRTRRAPQETVVPPKDEPARSIGNPDGPGSGDAPEAKPAKEAPAVSADPKTQIRQQLRDLTVKYARRALTAAEKAKRAEEGLGDETEAEAALRGRNEALDLLKKFAPTVGELTEAQFPAILALVQKELAS